MSRARRPTASMALAALLLLIPGRAAANGKFPAAGQIVVDPGDPAHVLVRTTFGILVSRDHAKTFDLICESGAGYAGNVDPGIAVTADGTLLAGIFEGIDVGRGDACSWQLAGGAPSGVSILDVSVVKSQPKIAVALGVGAAGNSVFRSDDDAVTWTLAGALPASFQGITLDVAPSDPGRLYVSGLDKGAGLAAALARSADGGASWEVIDIPMVGSRAPYLAAIDPNDAGVIYVRLDGTPGTLLVSKDGGQSWATILTLPGYMQGFALSPDGATVLAGSPSDGLWRAPVSTYAFQRVKTTGVQCLAWSGAEVYACGTEVAVSRSTDQGDTFTPLLRLSCIRGPLACGAGTPVDKLCPAEWESLKEKIGTQYCDQGAGGGGGGTQSTTTTGPSTGAGDPASPRACACRAGETSPGSAGAVLSGLLALLAAARRKARAGARIADRAAKERSRGRALYGRVTGTVAVLLSKDVSWNVRPGFKVTRSE
jgi:MYXO-CTERM domain-containing protein